VSCGFLDYWVAGSGVDVGCFRRRTPLLEIVWKGAGRTRYRLRRRPEWDWSDWVPGFDRGPASPAWNNYDKVG